jgi:hypothetical protein
LTISYYSFREKYEVQTIGSSNVRGRTRGTRTVAGTLIFAATNEHPLLPLLRSGAVRSTFSGILYPDELMPFDIILSFLSQNPDQYDPHSTVASRIVLSGIDIGNESSTISIHQSNTESVMQFMALGLTPMIDASGIWPGQDAEGGRAPIDSTLEEPGTTVTPGIPIHDTPPLDIPPNPRNGLSISDQDTISIG